MGDGEEGKEKKKAQGDHIEYSNHFRNTKPSEYQPITTAAAL